MEYAATNRCRLFISSSLVYSQFKVIYHPHRLDTLTTHDEAHAGAAEDDSDDGDYDTESDAHKLLWAIVLVLYNFLWLPLLILVPRAVVRRRYLRQQRDRRIGRRRVLTVVWLLPSGRMLLEFASGLSLAIALSMRMPGALSPGPFDYVLLLYAASMLHASVSDLFEHGWHAFIRDLFQLLDAAVVSLLIGIEACAFAEIYTHGAASPSNGAAIAGLILQSLCTLIAWLRLVKIAYAFPAAGPMLLTVLYLLFDLATFSISILFILFSFACAFMVLAFGSTPRDGVFFERMWLVLHLLLGVTLNGEPQSLEADETPFIESVHAGALGMDVGVFVLMVLFGFIVVLLLLTMIIARFSASVETASEFVDLNYKLKFAHMVVTYRSHIHGARLAPQVRNLPPSHTIY